MDKQTVIGFILIAIVFTIWMVISSQQTVQPPKPTEKVRDSVKSERVAPKAEVFKEPVATDSTATSNAEKKFGKYFAALSSGNEETFTVETSKYIAEFSTKGGGIRRWTLKGFKTWYGQRCQLMDWNSPSDASILFVSNDGKLIDSRSLYFSFTRPENSHYVKLEDSAKYTFDAYLPVDQQRSQIVKKYTLIGGKYSFDLEVEMRGMGSIISNNEYQVSIQSPALTEKNTVDEASFAKANAFVNGDKIQVDATSENEQYRENVSGKTLWICAHNKYFLNALIVKPGFEGDGVYLEGVHKKLPNGGVREIYLASIKFRYGGEEKEISKFSVFIGPMEYDLLMAQGEGLEKSLDLGWSFVVRPFAEYLFIPLFSFLHKFVPNFGIVIIVFTILIKLLLYPLTKSSMKSMKRMQSLQPMMNEIREKYKDDQQKQNTEIMRLYKDYGVNPAGGCLPLILQMPILFALFTVFRSTIELRQAPFAFWITDLSAPDVLFSVPFELPLLGTSAISGLALAMAITMFVQQKQSIKDPRQKSMVYIMPVMFWIMFNGFPSGLNLYYFMFNLLSIGQQYVVNKRSGDDALVKVPAKKRKKGWMERAMESIEQKSKQQRR